MGDPDARLLAAVKRYDAAYRAHSGARPGTSAEVELARARLDLALLLAELDELPDGVQDQLQRDADVLLRTAPPLEG